MPESNSSKGNLLPLMSTDLVSRSQTVRRWLYWVWKNLSSGFDWLFGLVSLLVGLSILATIPVIQFLSLGYLLESSGRIVRTGNLRAGFVGIRKASRVGSLVVGTWLALLPARLVSSFWYSSYLLNGPSRQATVWRIVLIVVLVLTAIHVLWAWFRGGRLRHFIWPAPLRFCRCLRAGGMYQQARDATCNFLESLHLSHYFMLGAKGFVAAAIWLSVPVTLLVLASRVAVPLGVFCGFVGTILFAAVLLYLPFLQGRFGATNRFGAMFELREIRRRYQAAPFAFLIAFSMTLLFALPLYLLKAELVPRKAAWLPSLVFVLFMFPARLATGWALARSQKRELPRHFLFRWTAWFAMLPVVGFYVLIVYFTQYVSWYGGLSLYEQHAFLLPVPFLGL